MALAAGFGVDLTNCDPEVFEAIVERLNERAEQEKRAEMMDTLRARMGR